MPAFSFEKIAPPAKRSASVAIMKEPRGVIVQMLDRITESRLQREARRLDKPRGDFAERKSKP